MKKKMRIEINGRDLANIRNGRKINIAVNDTEIKEVEIQISYNTEVKLEDIENGQRPLLSDSHYRRGL